MDLEKYGEEEWKNSRLAGMYAAMDMGFIRFMPESWAFDMHQMPTQEQFGVIREIIRKKNGRVIIELNEEVYVEYEYDTPEEYIIEGIKSYYRRGEIPKPFMDDDEDYE